MTQSIALDLGTTRIKGAVLDDAGTLSTLLHTPSPSVAGGDLVRECDPVAYLEKATDMLAKLCSRVPDNTPMGITSQRSSFVLWDKDSGACVTPLISWQDRRAKDWCNAHEANFTDVTAITGLFLSPHYVGPKLAWLMEHDAAVREGMEAGRLMFGTLETYMIWHWSEGRVHQTDATMAARTLMFDLRSGAWSNELIRRYGVEGLALPQVVSTMGQSVELALGPRVTATVADQSAGVLAMLGDDESSALVNLGTGGFVMRPTGSDAVDRTGYLSGPLLARSDGHTHFAVEGTINGAGASVDLFGRGPTALLDEDPSPEGFCLPDNAGIGAPHWRAGMNMQFSRVAEEMEGEDKRRLVMEGILFRVREILEDICDVPSLSRIVLTGGLARDTFMAQGLSDCLGRPIELCDESEATILGVARLAAGMAEDPSEANMEIDAAGGHYLETKYHAWQTWMGEVLDVS